MLIVSLARVLPHIPSMITWKLVVVVTWVWP